MTHDPDDQNSVLLRRIESGFDTRYRCAQLPHPIRTISVWYFLTVLEDTVRYLYVKSGESEAIALEEFIDKQKYSARYGLERIFKECTDSTQSSIPARVVPKLYTKAVGLLHAGIEYLGAAQLCTAAHVGTVSFKELYDTIEIVIDPTKYDFRYAVLELLSGTPYEDMDHASRIYFWARNQSAMPHVVDAIARTIRIEGAQVLYRYNTALAVGLAENLAQPPSLVPAGWKFLWGENYETTLLINALCVRCAYHLVAVHFGALQNGLKGWGVASLLLIIPKARLMSDLQAISSLDLQLISKFVDYLTLGTATETPDPSLQPLIRIDNQLAIPCLFFLSSNHERNLMSLQARVEGPQFNAMSKMFETKMIEELTSELAPKWPQMKGSITVRDKSEFEELDMVFADLTTKTLLLCELRWMLQPGDPREVQNRKRVCWEKEKQLARKVLWIQGRVSLALKALDINGETADGWRVEGIVVIETFGGVRSNNPNLPIMPRIIFERGLLHSQSLRDFADWSRSLCWLPSEGSHYRVEPRRMKLEGIEKDIAGRGIERLCTREEYFAFITKSIVAHGRDRTPP